MLSRADIPKNATLACHVGRSCHTRRCSEHIGIAYGIDAGKNALGSIVGHDRNKRNTSTAPDNRSWHTSQSRAIPDRSSAPMIPAEHTAQIAYLERLCEAFRTLKIRPVSKSSDCHLGPKLSLSAKICRSRFSVVFQWSGEVAWAGVRARCT